MNDTELFVLSDNIEFIQLDSISEQVKRNFDHDANDVVVTHHNTRKSSKVINKDLMILLKGFEKPRSWAEVIITYSVKNKKDPQQVADEVFELLTEMKEEGYLVLYNKDTYPGHSNLLKVDDVFRTYRVKEKLQVMNDSEVYIAEDRHLNKFILKLFKADKDDLVSSTYKNEITILKKLDGVVNPVLTETGSEEGIYYIITEWFEGVTAELAAGKYKNCNSKSNVVKLFDTCISILQAYNHLHKQGVFHGDIHPKNILISGEGIVKIIDYGISATKSSDLRLNRAGVCFHYEPELAIAVHNGKEPPPSTEKSEQYAIATLLYLLLTGRHYLNFSLESEKLFRQIMETPPIPFKSWDINLPDELDNVFSIALAKEPSKRFSSLIDFANELKKIRHTILLNHDFFVERKENSAGQFVEFLIRKFGWDSSFITNGLLLPPRCSVNFGAAGIAYMYYRMACIREDTSLLNLADVWANKAAAYVSDYGKSFYSSELDISSADLGKRSMYHSPTGVYIVQSLISNCRGDTYALSRALEHFFIAAREPCDKIDLAFGKAGLLVGSSILFRELKSTHDFKTNSIILFANGIMEELWKQLSEYPGINQLNPINYYGIAHGWAGILYGTLYWCKIAKQELPIAFRGRVEELLHCAMKDKNGLNWSLANSEAKIFSGWCNGNAGYIFLWSLLYEYFKEERYLSIAEQSANPILPDTQEPNGGLCCGVTGQVYAFLRLYKITGNRSYLQKTEKLKHHILHHLSSPLLKNNSLFFGEVGLGIVLCELDKPESARMPFFE